MSINVTARDFDELVLRAEKPVLLDVWAPWCPHCRRIGPAFEQVGEQHGDRLTAAMLNYDEARELATAMGSIRCRRCCCSAAGRSSMLLSRRPPRRPSRNLSGAHCRDGAGHEADRNV